MQLIVIATLFWALVVLALKNERTRPYARPAVRFMFDRLLPATLFLALVYANITVLGNALAEGGGWLAVLRTGSNMAFLFLVAILFMVRRSPQGPRSTRWQALIALAGTFSINLVGLETPTPGTSSLVIGAGAALVVFGWLWSIISLATLGRCFGIFPEARGLVTHGPYRLVRHPLYFGEIVAALGIALPVLSPLTVAAWLLMAGLQLWRSLYEERTLTAVFPEYAMYRAQTRRLIPLLW